MEYEAIDSNPAKGKRRRLRVAKPTRTYLDRADQIESLLDAAGALDAKSRAHPGLRRAMVAMLVFAGPRLGEMLALRWRDVDLAGGTIYIADAKTDAGVGEVSIRPALRDELTAYKATCGSPAPSALVFPTTKGNRWGQSNVRRRVFDPAVKLACDRRAEEDLAPLPEGLTPHSMRRTFASVLYALGEPPTVVMAEMRHTDPKLALIMYAKAMRRSPDEIQRLRALVGVAVDSPSAVMEPAREAV